MDRVKIRLLKRRDPSKYDRILEFNSVEAMIIKILYLYMDCLRVHNCGSRDF